MKSETQTVIIVSIHHQKTTTPPVSFYYPPRDYHTVGFFWGPRLKKPERCKRLFLRDRVCRFFLRAEYTQPEVGSGEQNLQKLSQIHVRVFLNHSGRNWPNNLKKLPQMTVSGFLNHSGRNCPNPDCIFYLPVSMSRNVPLLWRDTHYRLSWSIV